MNRRTGKAVLQGHGAIVVTLPKDWVLGHGVSKGDPLDVSYDDRAVHIRPIRKASASDTGGRNPSVPAARPAQLVPTDGVTVSGAS